jgi:hypothetical protein
MMQAISWGGAADIQRTASCSRWGGPTPDPLDADSSPAVWMMHEM